MKTNSLILTGFLLLQVAAVNAGTPGLSGLHSGNYDLTVRTNTGLVMANSYQSYSWEFNFDQQTAAFTSGYIVSPLSLIPLRYAAHQPVSLIDNGDGTYTADYVFQAYNPLFGNPSSATTTTFEITQTSTGLTIRTLDSDGDGVPGEAIYGVFPFDIELDWHGTTN